MTYAGLCFLLLPFLVSAREVKLDVTPVQIQLGLTDQLDVNCTYPPDPSSNEIVTVIIILRSTDTVEPNFTTIAVLDPFANNSISPLAGQVDFKGNVSEVDVSFLSLRWTNPNLTEAGRYRCEVTVIDDDNDATFAKEITVTHVNPDFNSLLDELNSVTASLHSAIQNVTDLWDKRLSDAKSAVFKESALFDGRVYLLSRYNNMSFTEAEWFCNFQGGHLVEITGENELINIRDFFRSILVPNDTLVLIGGTDQTHEGEWVYQRKLDYFSWAHGHPSNSSDNDNDCLALDVDLDLNMVDVPCSRFDQAAYNRFLCEIPHAPYKDESAAVSSKLNLNDITL